MSLPFMQRSGSSPTTYMSLVAARQACGLLLLALGLAIVSARFSALHSISSSRNAAVRQIAVDDAIRLSGTTQLLWIDARSPSAFHAAHVAGAINLTEDDWESLIRGFVEVWQPGEPVVIYCDSVGCDASEAVAKRLLREFEAKNVYTLEGGWVGWQERKL